MAGCAWGFVCAPRDSVYLFSLSRGTYGRMDLFGNCIVNDDAVMFALREFLQDERGGGSGCPIA